MPDGIEWDRPGVRAVFTPLLTVAGRGRMPTSSTPAQQCATMQEAIKKAGALIEARPYIQRFSGRPVVIKFGGSAMTDAATLDGVLQDVVFLATVGIKPLIVHGGGPQISRGMQEAGLRSRFVRGHRVTDGEALEVVLHVLVEQINADLVERIQRHGGRARSAFPGERSLLHARKKLLPARSDSQEPTDLGYVGEVDSVEAEELLGLCSDGTVAVMPPIGQDASGQLYNLNADTAAGAVAAALQAEKVVFLSDVHGIRADPADPDSFLSTVTEEQIDRLIEQGAVSGGMLPKVSACIEALEAGVGKAHIIDGRLPHSLLLEIFTDEGVGTQILHPTGA